MVVNDLTIVVCCNKRDVSFARICIASIRYYYPDISIELIKDRGNGVFSTRDIEKYFDVKVVDLGIEKMGWSGAKFHYLYQEGMKGKKVLILDADIVFIGPFLERMLPAIASNDYVVSIEQNDIFNLEWVRNTYFDIAAIQRAYPSYKYPGYFFNAGQIFLTLGSIEENVLNEFFNVKEYPFWLKNELFPLVDQSVYNYLLPVLNDENKIRLGKGKFMLWAAGNDVLNCSLKEIENNKLTCGVIHWAGCLRIPLVIKMVRGDVLVFFENYFFKKIPLGFLKKGKVRILSYLDFTLKNIYRRTIKKTIFFKK